MKPIRIILITTAALLTTPSPGTVLGVGGSRRLSPQETWAGQLAGGLRWWCIQRAASTVANRRSARWQMRCGPASGQRWRRRRLNRKERERRLERCSGDDLTSDLPRLREVDLETFETAWKRAIQAVRERAPLADAELAAGWSEDPAGSCLRLNVVTGEWDDTCFVHVAPRRARPS